MKRLDQRLGRGLSGTTIASVVTVAVFALAAGGAEAAPPTQVDQARQAASQMAPTQTVLSSQYGQMDSRVKGEFRKHGTVEGVFKPRRFIVRNHRLLAVGRLQATLVKGNGDTIGTAVERIRIPVRSANGEPARSAAADAGRSAAALAPGCDILNLVLGPLDLDLLGLEVHLNRVVLDIIATPGPGNLLGNLLCAVAGLLDGTGQLVPISQILNAILALLRL